MIQLCYSLHSSLMGFMTDESGYVAFCSKFCRFGREQSFSISVKAIYQSYSMGGYLICI